MSTEKENAVESGQDAKINSIDELLPDEVWVKKIGREEVNWTVHTHNKHQIIYTMTGTLHITVGEERHFVTARHIVWIPAGVSHLLSSNNAQISLMVCYFTMPKAASDTLSIFAANEFVASNLLYISKYGLISKRESPKWYGFVSNLLALIPQECPRSTFSSLPFMVSKSSRLYPVLEYIGENYMRDLDVATVASRFSMSVRSLTRLFTSEDVRFVHYLNYMRVVRALELISDNTMSIEHIAYEVGFGSPNSFNRVFKQLTGSPPSAFMP